MDKMDAESNIRKPKIFWGAETKQGVILPKVSRFKWVMKAWANRNGHVVTKVEVRKA